MINGEDELITEGTPKGAQITFNSWKKLIDYCLRDTNQENDVGNDHGRDSVAPRLHFSSFFLFFLSFSFFFPTSEPLNPSHIGRSYFMAQASQMLAWVSQGLEKYKKDPFAPFLDILLFFLIKTQSDSLLRL